MIAIIYRTYTPAQTLGSFYLIASDGAFYKLKSLELPWLNNKSFISCIPEGVYICRPRTSKLFGEHFEILNVPGRDKILIHIMNFIGSPNPITNKVESNGCIGLGMQHLDITKDGILDLSASGKALNFLNSITDRKEFTLIIKEKII
jgi:hypothetical protein